MFAVVLAVVEAMTEAMLRHMVLVQGLFTLLPKHHLWVHMTQEAQRLGNPVYHNTFLDESLNGVLKAACRSCHQMVFERSALRRMHELLPTKRPRQ